MSLKGIHSNEIQNESKIKSILENTVVFVSLCGCSITVCKRVHKIWAHCLKNNSSSCTWNFLFTINQFLKFFRVGGLNSQHLLQSIRISTSATTGARMSGAWAGAPGCICGCARRPASRRSPTPPWCWPGRRCPRPRTPTARWSAWSRGSGRGDPIGSAWWEPWLLSLHHKGRESESESLRCRDSYAGKCFWENGWRGETYSSPSARLMWKKKPCGAFYSPYVYTGTLYQTEPRYRTCVF